MAIPMKSLLLYFFKDQAEHWDYEMVDKLMAETGKNSDYWKWQFRFWLMEFMGCGLIQDVAYAADDGTHFKDGNVLSKYKITELGLQRIDTMLE